MAMAAVVVFLTTYALILPAITIDKESSTPAEGIYLEEGAEESHDLKEEDKSAPKEEKK